MVEFFGKYTGFGGGWVWGAAVETIHVNTIHVNTIHELYLQLLTLFFRNWIVSMSCPRMTAADAFGAEPEAFEDAPFVDGFDHVLRAGRRVTAVVAEMWRDRRLVKTNG